MEVAFGAALAGKRSACVMKHVGVNVAADPLFTIAYTGVNAGMVICVADDPGMHSSQNEQDSRHYAVSAKLPMLEPADSEEARAFAKRAFQLSEEYDTRCFSNCVPASPIPRALWNWESGKKSRQNPMRRTLPST